MKLLLIAVAIIANQPGYYTSLANHIARWLKNESVPARVSPSQSMASSLKGEKLAFLVGFDSVTAQQMKLLRDFRAGGGKLVVFHSASPALADLMGVRPLGYKAADYPGQWSRMDFVTSIPEGLPKSIHQTSTVLQRAVPIKGRGRVIATWADRNGRSSGDAAWIVTSAGYWMTHVLLADGDEDLKAQLLGAISGSAVPGSWSYSLHNRRKNAKAGAMRSYALAQVPRKGEIHAVWDHSGCGLYPGDWSKTMRVLQAARVTDLFVNVAGAGFAHYASKVLPRSSVYEKEGDQLSACIAAAKGTGIRVHAWMLCFNATRSTPGRLAEFRKRGWCLRTVDGKTSEYLNPTKAEVRAHVLAAISEMQSNYAVHGIHLDFVR